MAKHCRHCRRKLPLDRHRRLCRGCYADLTIRARYPVIKHVRCGGRPKPGWKKCRHCGRIRPPRRRNLCRECYAAVRDKYPIDASPTAADCCPGCGREVALWRRGVCFSCYQDVRKRRPSGQGRGSCTKDFYGSPPLPPPCAALPGSEDKIKILRYRASKGLALHGRDRKDRVHPTEWDFLTQELG
jgi:hypothetical protein